MKLTGAAARQFLDRPKATYPALLLFGSNRSLIGDAAAGYVKAVLGPGGAGDAYAVTKLTDEDLKRDPVSLSDALAAQSLLGDARLVRVRLESETQAKVVLAALAEIEAGAQTNMLLVEAHGASTTGALVKGFEAAGRAACVGFYDESAADLDTFARDLLARDGVRIETDAFTHLRAVLPEDRQALRQEIDKLSLYAADLDRPVSIEDLDALLGDAAALALDQALAEALSGRGAAAVETLERVISGSPISTLKALERRLLRLTEVRTRIDTGASAADAMKTLRPPPFFKERDALVAELRVWRANTLAKALDAVWRSETAAKRAGAPQDLLVAQCFREVAALVGGSAR